MSRSLRVLAATALSGLLLMSAVGCADSPPPLPYSAKRRIAEPCAYDVVPLGDGKYAVRVDHHPDPQTRAGFAQGSFDARVAVSVTSNRRTTKKYIDVDATVDLVPIPSMEPISVVAHESCEAYEARGS